MKYYKIVWSMSHLCFLQPISLGFSYKLAVWCRNIVPIVNTHVAVCVLNIYFFVNAHELFGLWVNVSTNMGVNRDHPIRSDYPAYYDYLHEPIQRYGCT